MGRFIIKAAEDQDLYCEWSSIVDAPTFVGSRNEIHTYLCQSHTAAQAERWLERADETGTSLEGFGQSGDVPTSQLDGAWEDAGFVVEQRGWLPRERLSDFLASFRGDVDYGLLEPFEDATAETTEGTCDDD